MLGDSAVGRREHTQRLRFGAQEPYLNPQAGTKAEAMHRTSLELSCFGRLSASALRSPARNQHRIEV